MCPQNDSQGLPEVSGAVQMANAAAICTSEARNWQKPLAYLFGDAAFEILVCRGDYHLMKAGKWQKVVYMPAPGFSLTSYNPQVSLHPLKAARAPSRACIGIIALRK